MPARPTTQDLVDLVRFELGEDDPNNATTGDPIIVKLLNAAARRLGAFGHFIPSCGSMNLEAAKQYYLMPYDFWGADAVFLSIPNGPQHELSPMTTAEYDPSRPSGPPEKYLMWGCNDTATGQHRYAMVMQPTPDAAMVAAYGPLTDVIEIFFRQFTAEFDLAGIDPELLQPWADGCVSYALWKIYRRLGRGYSTLAEEAKTEWMSILAQARKAPNPLTWDVPRPRLDTMGLNLGDDD